MSMNMREVSAVGSLVMRAREMGALGVGAARQVGMSAYGLWAVGVAGYGRVCRHQEDRHVGCAAAASMARRVAGNAEGEWGGSFEENLAAVAG